MSFITSTDNVIDDEVYPINPNCNAVLNIDEIEVEEADEDDKPFIVDSDNDDDDIIIPDELFNNKINDEPLFENHFGDLQTERTKQLAKVWESAESTQFEFLPPGVQKQFIDEFYKRDSMLNPRITQVIERSDNSSYWTVTTRHLKMSLKDFVLYHFIPENNYYDENLLLRTDYDDRDANYVQTALCEYEQQIGIHYFDTTEVFSENPQPEQKHSNLIL